MGTLTNETFRYLLILQTEEDRKRMLKNLLKDSEVLNFTFRVNLCASTVFSDYVHWKLVVINSKHDALKIAGLEYSEVYYYPECNLDEETKCYIESRRRNPSV